MGIATGWRIALAAALLATPVVGCVVQAPVPAPSIGTKLGPDFWQQFIRATPDPEQVWTYRVSEIVKGQQSASRIAELRLQGVDSHAHAGGGEGLQFSGKGGATLRGLLMLVFAEMTSDAPPDDLGSWQSLGPEDVKVASGSYAAAAKVQLPGTPPRIRWYASHQGLVREDIPQPDGVQLLELAGRETIHPSPTPAACSPSPDGGHLDLPISLPGVGGGAAGQLHPREK